MKPEHERLAAWHDAMADEPKRAESKRIKHRASAAAIRELSERAESAKAELAKFIQAVGLASTIKGEMPMRPDDPIGMMQEVVSYVAEHRAELAKLKGHASVMHKVLSWLHATGGKGLREHAAMGEVLDAYRADYPEEGK